MSFKDTILREATHLFERNGIDNFTEKSLQQKLDISEATFQGFFRDKEDLVTQAYRQKLEDDRHHQEKLIKAADNPIKELLSLIEFGSKQLEHISPAYLADVVKRPAIMEAAAENMQDYSYPLIYSILNKGVVGGYFRSEMNMGIVTRVILENVYLLINTRVFPPESFNTREVFRNIYLYYIRGLCVKDHIDQTDKYFT